MIVSYGGEMTFYEQNDDTIENVLERNKSQVEDRLEELAENLDAILPQYYLM